METERPGARGPAALTPSAATRRYSVQGFMDKNRDALFQDFKRLLYNRWVARGSGWQGPQQLGHEPPLPMARKLTNGPAGVEATLPEGGLACSLCPQHRPHPAGHVARRAAGHHRGDQAPPDSRHPLQELHGGPGGKPGL